MSQANVEIVRSMLETWDADGFDAIVAAFDPDVEVVDLQTAMGMQDRARGPEGLRGLAQQWIEIFDDWRVEVRDLVDLGGEWVMAEVRFHGVGRDSGIPVSNRQFEVYRLVDGRNVEIRVGFHDRDEALQWSGRRKAAARAARPLSGRGRRAASPTAAWTRWRGTAASG
jgi:ketosteroid isomerase-like protein